MAADRLTQRQIIKGCIGLVSDAALPAPTAIRCYDAGMSSIC